MLRTGLLAVHAGAGVVGLVLGPLALWRLARPVSQPAARLEAAYLVAVAVVSASAVGLVLADLAAFWWLGVIAVLTGGAAYGAHRLRHRRHRVVCAWRTRLFGGTYVALVTATVVVSAGGWLSWVLPSVIGAAGIEYAASQESRRLAADQPRKDVVRVP